MSMNHKFASPSTLVDMSGFISSMALSFKVSMASQEAFGDKRDAETDALKGFDIWHVGKRLKLLQDPG